MLTLHCDPGIRDLFCAAIRDYAHAAYPPGGSDCAQVARYTLLELAATIESAVTADCHTVRISRRPRAQLAAALTWCFDRQDAHTHSSSARQRALLAGLLREQLVSSADLAAARAADAGPG